MAKLPVGVHKELTRIQEETIPHFHRAIKDIEKDLLHLHNDTEDRDIEIDLIKRLYRVIGLLDGCYFYYRKLP